MSAWQRRLWHICALALFATTAPAAETIRDCLPAVSVPLRVQIGTSAPTPALLEGGLETPLRLLDALSGRLLWSAGMGSTTVQRFEHMDAPVTGSIAAIDLDVDGLHDRLYVGDMAGRLWRFDLHHGGSAVDWATGGILADFSNPEGRSFLAAPDVSLASPAGAPPWLNIAVGTAAPGNAAANNRFYVLRDADVNGAWSQQQYDHWHAWTEPDLRQVTASVSTQLAASEVETAQPGWFVELGSGHVLTPTLTIAGRTTLVVADHFPRGGACEVFARMAMLDLDLQRIQADGATTAWQHPLPRRISTTEGIIVAFVEHAFEARCSIDGIDLPGCAVDSRPRTTWWRRDGAQ